MRAFIFYYVFYTKSQKYTHQVKTIQFTLCIIHIVKNTDCVHSFVADIAFLTNFLVKNALVYNTNHRFSSEKYTVGKNLSKNTRYSKVISVSYNQWKIHDGI